MKIRRHFIKFPVAAGLIAGLTLSALPALAQPVQLLNVSYDGTRVL
jgi:sulfate transport system substrate-binding protein